jgi:hypothetical protein
MRSIVTLLPPERKAVSQGGPMRKSGVAKFVVFLSAALATAPVAFSQTEAASPALSANEVVQHLMEKNRERAIGLQHYVGTRLYRLEYRGFPASADATMQVEVDYDAPASKHFTVVNETGSKLIQSKVFHRLLESEEQAGDQENRKHTELGPENYNFTLAGVEGTNYVLNVEPKVESKFLYRGKIWVDAHDFAVTRIEAQPAKNPSFWTTKSLIHHTYQKLDNGFYLPRENKTVTSVRLGGTATLTIEYQSYQLTAAKPVAQARKISASDGAIWADGNLSEGLAHFISGAR